MTQKTTPESLLHEIASIRQLEKGTLSPLRQTSTGVAFNFQRWEAGRNRSEYIKPDQLAQVEDHLKAYVRFEDLIEQYVEALSTRSREERLDRGKKKRLSPSSALPKKRKFKTS